jgi:hypothetical protein
MPIFEVNKLTLWIRELVEEVTVPQMLKELS